MPRKILIIINNFGVGGAERLVIDDANELILRNDCTVKIITLKKEGTNSLAADLDATIEWEIVDFKGFFDISSWIVLYTQVTKYKPSVVFSHLWFANTITRILGAITRLRTMSFEHNVYDDLKTGKMFLLDRILQYCSTRIVAVSSAVKTSLVRHGISSKKIDVITNGINRDLYMQATPTGRNELGIPENSFVYISVGRLIYQKGMDVLIKAFAMVTGEPTLIIVGDGPDRGTLMSLAGELSVSERVHFVGIRKDVPQLLKMADCFVLTSRYEGLGIVVLEALASGKPVLITDFEAGKDIVTSGVDALVVLRDDIQQISSGMSELMYNKTLRQTLSENAVKRSADFGIQMHVNKLLHYLS